MYWNFTLAYKKLVSKDLHLYERDNKAPLNKHNSFLVILPYKYISAPWDPYIDLILSPIPSSVTGLNVSQIKRKHKIDFTD